MKYLIIIFCILFIILLLYSYICDTNYFTYFKNETLYGIKGNYLQGIDVIYWINLDRSHDRRKHMENVLNDNVFDNIEKNRITASDGKKDDTIMQNFVLDKKSSITIIEYATLLSHLNAIREFSTSTHEIALIFEDDVTLDLKSHWKKPISEIIQNAPSDWEIIQLYYIMDINYEIPENEYTFIKNNNFIINNNNNTILYYDRNKVSSYSTAAYIINKKAALRFTKNFYKDNKYYVKNYHHVADVYMFNQFKSYTYKFPFFVTIDDVSTIDSAHIDQNTKSKKYLLKKLFNID